MVALTGLAAWLVVAPLMAAILSLFGASWNEGPMDAVLGLVFLVGGVVALRRESFGIFVEQMGLPLLLTGLFSLAHALDRGLTFREVQAVMLVLTVGLVTLLPAAWLRQLLGAGAAVLLMLVISPRHHFDLPLRPLWIETHGAALVAVLLMGLQVRLGRQASGARWAAMMEPALGGAWVMVLGALMLGAGLSFLVGGALGMPDWVADHPGGLAARPGADWAAGLLSSALVLVGAWAVVRAWRPARPWRLLPPAVVLAGIALHLPMWGACLAVLSLMLVTRRWRLAIVAAIAAVWVLGSFYYSWAMPLQKKALVMAAAGLALAAWAAWMGRADKGAMAATASELPGAEARRAAGSQGAPVASPRHHPGARWAPILLALFAVLVFITVNLLILQKESLIRDGRPVYVKLAPVDPRSLMQGDYMRLAYALPGTERGRSGDVPLWGERRRVAVRLDERGIVTSAQGLASGAPAPTGMLAVELTPASGGWTLVSDAWYFKEGTQSRWAAARYGEFRLTPDGRALLVNLVGEDLRPL
ncbi:GDYXXLXY domain-containing protein [Roseateles terrae]|uniref:Membrane-anchored protein n=1 Tax=Roseateles terrae TaxID=431060 RepID=A0ABR6GR86_9BURK|nr:GDYXXLXY domain-containing protein [Roseateles terrae]MBB3194633.1 putative membrane-anchored protein [Roseateles terrae]